MKFLFMQLLPQQAPQTPSTTATKEQLLAQLHDVIAPGTVSWWPLAIGWWVLAIIVIGLIITSIAWLLSYSRANKYRQQAKTLIKQLSLSDSLTIAEYAQAVTAILKRCYFVAYPQHKNLAARSYGEQWQNLLTASLPHNHTFIEIPWSTILYSNIDTGFSKQSIQEFALTWVSKHNRRAGLQPPQTQSNQTKISNAAPNKQGAKYVSV